MVIFLPFILSDGMKKLMTFFFLGFVTLLLVKPGVTMAQVNPQKISSALITESVNAVLGTEKKVTWHAVPVSDSAKAAVQGRLKAKSTIVDTLYLGTVNTDQGIQYVLPDIAPSRSEKFSYLLYVNASKQITGVDVLEYRESYGYEIDYSFFRNQFKGKKRARNVRFGRTIQNISGATISARSLTNSVHDLLLIVNEVPLP